MACNICTPTAEMGRKPLSKRGGGNLCQSEKDRQMPSSVLAELCQLMLLRGAPHSSEYGRVAVVLLPVHLCGRGI